MYRVLMIAFDLCIKAERSVYMAQACYTLREKSSVSRLAPAERFIPHWCRGIFARCQTCHARRSKVFSPFSYIASQKTLSRHREPNSDARSAVAQTFGSRAWHVRRQVKIPRHLWAVNRSAAAGRETLDFFLSVYSVAPTVLRLQCCA